MEATAIPLKQTAPSAELPPRPPPDRSLHYMGGLLCAGILLSAIGFSWWAVREPKPAIEMPMPREPGFICARQVGGPVWDLPRLAPGPAEPATGGAAPNGRKPAAPPLNDASLPAEPQAKPTLVGMVAADAEDAAPLSSRDAGAEADEVILKKGEKPKGPPSWTEAQLVGMLRRVPTFAVNDPNKPKLVAAAQQEQRKHPTAANPLVALQTLLKSQPRLEELPFQQDSMAQLSPERAKEMAYLSPRLRAVVKACTKKVNPKYPWMPKEVIQVKALREVLLKGEWKDVEVSEDGVLNLKATVKNWRQPAAAPILNQILMGEGAEVRLLLVEL